MADYIVLRRAPVPGVRGDAESFGITTSAVGTAATLDRQDLAPREAVDINRDPNVIAVTPPMPTRLIEPISVDAGAAAQSAWGIKAVGADQSQFTGNGVTVAVLDTGIDNAHPAFAGVTLEERDFSGDGNGDVNGHGSHCAGTIFGRDVNGTRIGVARGVERALIGKVLGNDGGGDSSMIFQAIQWAITGGANVISMSLGFDFPGMVTRLIQNGWPADLATSTALEAYRGNLRMFDALMGMAKAGAPFNTDPVVIAAAGNESRRDVNANYRIAASLPAAGYEVVSVAAVQAAAAGAYSVASFSNSMPVLAGPGVDILSVKPGGGLVKMSGTSMACPHVAGVAALWWEYFVSNNLRPGGANVQAKLRATSRANVIKNMDEADVGLGLVLCP